MGSPRSLKYPRRGEPIVPRALLPLVIDRHHLFPADDDGEMLRQLDLGPQAWNRLPPEICQRLGLRVVDRVQTRLKSLPGPVRDVPLPDPKVALALPLERRTHNSLRRALATGLNPGPWTVGRYMSLRRFGGRALVDLMAASEAHGDEPAGGDGTANNIDDVLLALARELPIAEPEANSRLVTQGLIPGPLRLSELFRVAAQLGRSVPFRVIDLGGSRVVVRLSDVTTARTAYRIAARAIQGRGAVTVATITEQVRAAAHADVAQTFIERLLGGLAAFRWLARRAGWFWFVERPNRLRNNVRKVFSIAQAVPLSRLADAMFRPHPVALPDEAIENICAAVPGVHVVDGAVTIDRPFDRAQCLDANEARIVDLLERSGGSLPDRELRGRARAIGLSAAPVWRLLRSSPLLYRSPGGQLRLIGST